MSVEGRRKRIAAIQLAKQQWQEAQGNTDAIIEKKQMDKQMQGYGGPETSNYDPKITGITDFHPSQGGGGGQTTQAAADKAGDSWKDSPFAQGGRVVFYNGGLVGLL